MSFHLSPASKNILVTDANTSDSQAPSLAGDVGTIPKPLFQLPQDCSGEQHEALKALRELVAVLLVIKLVVLLGPLLTGSIHSVNIDLLMLWEAFG